MTNKDDAPNYSKQEGEGTAADIVIDLEAENTSLIQENAQLRVQNQTMKLEIDRLRQTVIRMAMNQCGVI